MIPGLAVTLKIENVSSAEIDLRGDEEEEGCADWRNRVGGSGGSWWSAASAAAGPVPDAAAAGASSSRLLEPAGQAAAR